MDFHTNHRLGIEVVRVGAGFLIIGYSGRHGLWPEESGPGIELHNRSVWEMRSGYG